MANYFNTKRLGSCYNNNAKSFSQALKIYGGSRIINLFVLNFAKPTYAITIYKNAKATNFNKGLVPMIISKDKTRVKTQILLVPNTNVHFALSLLLEQMKKIIINLLTYFIWIQWKDLQGW